MRRSWFLFALLAACGSHPAPPAPPPITPYEGGPIAARMTDVSIMFPLPTASDEVARLIPASAVGERGVLVPDALYEQVGPISGSSCPPSECKNDQGGHFGPGIADFGDLHVVAMRVDPCFGSLAPDPHGAGCAAQLRLVFQEVTKANPSSVVDSGLHAFYSLSREDLLDLASSLVTLRTASNVTLPRAPLAASPVIESEGLDGSYAAGVRALVLHYAGQQNLVRLATFDFGEEVIFWDFAASDVIGGAVLTPFVIPTLPMSSTSQGLGVSFLQGGGSNGALTPSTTSTDDITPLFGPTIVQSSATDAAFDALVRIENPTKNSPNTIDCGSCHLATPTELNVAKPLLGLDDRTSALAFQPDGVHVTDAEMAPTLAPQTSDFHAFSYFNDAATINQRVVNETAFVVQYLNALD